MKFSNGCWLNKEGYDLNFPMEVYDVRKSEKDVTIYAPFNHIAHRGKTLDGGMMTIDLSSPIEDVICVKMSHHIGGIDRGPHFELYKKDVPVQID